MRKYQRYLGVDVSKEHLDIGEYFPDNNQTKYLIRIQNIPSAIENWVKTTDLSNALVCMEKTGMYINFLVEGLLKQKVSAWVQNALHIKRSLGIVKGKNDKIDAQRIAKYAYRCEDEYRLFVPMPEKLSTLNVLYNERKRIKEMLAQLEVPLNETETFEIKTHQILEIIHTETIKTLKKSLKFTESEISQIIASDEHLQNLHTLISSVTGVGKETATLFIILTKGFTRFENVKQLACFAGVVPFESSSGKKISGDNISQICHKPLKSILYMCALVNLKTNEDLSAYYHKKRKEGKKHKVVMNALCNKILQRIWAVVAKNKPFEKKIVQFEKFESVKKKIKNSQKEQENKNKKLD